MNGSDGPNDASEDLGGEESTDAVKLGECGARRFDSDRDVAGNCDDTAIEWTDLGDELDGKAPQSLVGMVAGKDLRRM